MREPIVLAIESSCDETAVAILEGRTNLRTSLISSQIATHREYGGVVPEVASRQHLHVIGELVEEALRQAGVEISEVDLFAATHGPGLASSLLVGMSVAKGLALGAGKPFHAVNHIEGHLLSPFFLDGGEIPECIGLVVSGGHTLLVHVKEYGDYEVMGRSLDDAAGEAFDKVGKLLGLSYPGGPEIDRIAITGDTGRVQFPRSMMHSGDYQFSFSGLKTSVRYLLQKDTEDLKLEDICASFQAAVVDVLVAKADQASQARGIPLIAVSGGVSCNRRLREEFNKLMIKRPGLMVKFSEPRFGTDNAAMIAQVAMEAFYTGSMTGLEVDVEPNLGLNQSMLRA